MDEIELVLFQDLSKEDKDLILGWRNHENVRKWMYNTKPILEEEHFEFIESLRTNTLNKYFLVIQNKNKIGIIYFTNIDKHNKSSEFGIYSNPKIRGIGKLLMAIITSYAFKKMHLNRLIAEVYETNEKAIALYIEQGLKETRTKIVNGKKIICMEILECI